MKKGSLPNRNIAYVTLDFNNSDVTEIVETIKPHITKSPTYILLEGVLFFLDRNTSLQLFESFRRIQRLGDRIGSVSYTPEIEDKAVYARLLNYFDSNNHTGDSFKHQTIENSFYDNLNNYRCIERAHEFQLLRKYAPLSSILNKESILNEHFYILEKQQI